MTTSNVKAFVITKAMATMIREGAAASASATEIKKKAAADIARLGGRGAMFSLAGVKSGQISKETWVSLQATVAAGLFANKKDSFALWAMDSKLANKEGKQQERNKLVGLVGTYVRDFGKMIDTAFREHFPEAAALEAKAEAKAEAKDAPVTGADLRKRLIDLIADVAASEVKDREHILASLNQAEGRMSAW
jgi:hypothetical protein